ncbi:LacI family DNA-binding transcriptional regulator [Pantoea sp. S61]|uniref:LacI family DNA-binding transcriptional regulator n=1 Tax=Pantoea sp. S61 TaxID=2767442 RepID=UPI00190E1DD3|nr:LacI family DNA-binding transcriptional regulator [Pantoea sp. S61]MBK0127592.1 LacI family DNA-binding transcriptional regulator [Pantoea sp. S61]
MNRKPTMKELVDATQLSRATIDRVLNNRPGVNPKTIEAVQHAYSALLVEAAGSVHVPKIQTSSVFSVVVQAGDEYNASLKAAAERIQEGLGSKGITLHVCCCSDVDDGEVIRLLNTQAERADGIAIVAKNTPAINAAVHKLKLNGKHIIALVSDIEPDVRDAYVGINNRAAGQAAGFILGRHLQYCTDASVAVIVGTLSYSCHDDREIGFRAQIRKTFPTVSVSEVISGNDNTQQTYDAAIQLLNNVRNIRAIYNVAGGNAGLAAALDEFKTEIRPILVTHEVNEVTEKLIINEKIDYIISQDMSQLLIKTVEKLQNIKEGNEYGTHTFLPIEVITRFTLPTGM